MTLGKRFWPLILAITLLAASAQAALVPKADAWDYWAVSDESNAERVDHSVWQQLLDEYLSPDDSGEPRLKCAVWMLSISGPLRVRS